MSTVESAGQQLQTIIAKINTELTNNQRLSIRQELSAFMNGLPFRPEFETLRQTANTVSLKLKRQITQSTLEDIESRSAALASHVGAMDAIRRKAAANAKQLKLEAVKAVTDSATEIVKAGKSAKASIDSNSLTDAADDIEKIIDVATALMTEINALDEPDT